MGKKAKTSDELAKAWEGARRIRKRFQRGGPWVVFPPLPSSDRKKKDSDNLHPVSTAALALNAEAIAAIVQLYGPNPVHVEPLQKQAWGWLRVFLMFVEAYILPWAGGEIVRVGVDRPAYWCLLPGGMGCSPLGHVCMEEAVGLLQKEADPPRSLFGNRFGFGA